MTTPARSELPVAVVTGASRGIGLRGLQAAGRARLRGGARIPGPAGSELAAKELDPTGERVVAAHIEVDNSVNIDQLAAWIRKRWGRVDAIVNSASTAPDQYAIAGTTKSLAPVAGRST